MCYDVSAQLKSKIKYAKKVGASEEEVSDLEEQLRKHDWLPQYRIDGFSNTKPKMVVVTNEKPKEFQFFEWRFLSDSVVESKKFLNTLNAKAETIFDSWTYKKAAKEQHCIILIDGFFEPHGYGKIKETVRYGKTVKDYSKKAYYYIESKNDEPLSLAGLWNSWVDKETGEVHDTFTIITVPASPMMAKIHNVMKRMPAILPKELHDDWLNAVSKEDNPIEKTKTLELLKPFDDSLLQFKPVYNIKKKNSPGNEPDILKEFDYSGEEGFEKL